MQPNPHVHFERILKAAPLVQCTGCFVEMTLRTLDGPVEGKNLVSATFRCPRCTTETARQFVVAT